MIEKIIPERPKLKPENCVNPMVALTFVCNHFELLSDELKSKSRPRNLVRPRQIFFYLMYQNSNLSLTKIGSWVNRKNHTTVLHGVAQIEDLIFTTKEMKKCVSDLQLQINNNLWAKKTQAKKAETPEDRRSFIYSPIKKAS